MDVKKLVDDKIKENTELYARMDETKDLVYLDPYALKDWKDTIEKSISVTRNTPAWQAYVMSNKLLKVKYQTVVESSQKLPVTRIRAIENLSDAFWEQVDEYLNDNFGLSGGLNAWLTNHVVVRSFIGARWWLYRDKEGNLISDCLPVDMRWCPYELNEWYCNITWRSADSLQAEYGKDKDFNVANLSGTELEIWDFWSGTTEQLFIKGDKRGEKPNPYGSPPFVVVKPSVGFMLRDKGYIKYEAEDALFLDRKLYERENQIASIAQTLAMEVIRPGYEQPDKEIPVSRAPIPAPGMGEVTRTDVVHVKVERGDLNNAFLKAAQSIEQDIEHGGVTDTEAGNNTDPRSALWVTTQNELLNEKLRPRIDAIVSFRTKSMRLMIQQYMKLANITKSELEVGIQGMKYKFSPAQLGDPETYRISYRPMMVSKEQNIANVAIANAQRGLLPLRFILQDTLQMQDPDGIIQELEVEKAKQADPSIGMLEMALSYAEEAKELEGVDAEVKREMSRMLTENVVIMRRQKRALAIMPLTAPTKAAAETAPQEETKPNLQGLLALTGPGGNGGRPEGSMAKITTTTEAR